MLALAIFSMLIAALYATWTLVIRATIVGKRTAAQLQRERITMRTLEDSLTCIQSHQASMDYYLFDVVNGAQPLLSFTAYLPTDFPRSGEFLDTTSDEHPMDFHLRRVTFSLQSEPNGQKDLVLRQNPILMDLPAAEISTPLVLAHDVADFQIECWDTNNMVWATEWDATNVIPPLVRVTLGFNAKNSSGQSAEQFITREISFPSGTMPASVQSSGYNNSQGNGLLNFMNGNNGSTAPNAGGLPGSYNPYRPQGSVSGINQHINLGSPDLPQNSTQLP